MKMLKLVFPHLRATLPVLLLLTLLASWPHDRAGAAEWEPAKAPKREVRAVWLTTIGGIDWPHSYAQSERSAEKQRQELCRILDELKRAHINTVLLQTRIRATTIYPSDMEPWDGCLSGFPGRSPGYDALAFAIDECHKRGMELHAWVVTIPVGKWNQTGCRALRRKHPELVRKIGAEGYMNPENPRTGDYLARLCADIARRYDIDGIHLDYIRYPETWRIRVSRNEGRRRITSIVRKIHDAVKAEKPWVKMSCSPVGKADDLARYWSHGWNAYSTVCQDAQGWLREGLMDELFPMMYFRGNQFYPFAIDWKEMSAGRIVAPGLGIYFLDPREGNWRIGDVTRQMFFLRQIGLGHAFFRSKFFTDNQQGIYHFTCDDFNRYPSLVPEMTWGRHVATDETYNVYVGRTAPVDTADARNLMAVRLPRNEMLKCLQQVEKLPHVVTAMDRYGHERIVKQTPAPPLSVGSDLLECDGRWLRLPPKPSTLDASLVLITTLQGTPIASRPYRDGRVDVGSVPEGCYTVRSIGRKGVTHRLGWFIIKRKREGK